MEPNLSQWIPMNSVDPNGSNKYQMILNLHSKRFQWIPIDSNKLQSIVNRLQGIKMDPSGSYWIPRNKN